MTEIEKEIKRFEKAFNCKGFLKKMRTKSNNLCFIRIFYKAMQLEGYNPYSLETVIDKTFVSIYYQLRNISPIEENIAEEFMDNHYYKYTGILGTYND